MPVCGNIRCTRIAALAFVALAASCAEIEHPKPEQFFGVAPPPAKKEFRWSNGRLPKSIDPARAAAAPETDVVRAVYEGLTELDPKTLEAVPAIAEKWSSSDENRVWTFELRKTARWTNGKRVTAADFVASWRRAIVLGEKAAHRELLRNIVGTEPVAAPTVSLEQREQPSATPLPPVEQTSPVAGPGSNTKKPSESSPAVPTTKPVPLRVEAIDESTLKVMLKLPDKDFPTLVASTIFRPIYGSGEQFETETINNGIITNGPFRISLVSKDGVTLERSETYWNRAAVRLDSVRFVPKETAESALAAYRQGELDAVTNAELEPLALKLLTPYEDFRQARHSAVNLYEVNTRNAPFSDRRVREALATAIDRDGLIDSNLEGSTEPATTLLPLSGKADRPLTFDAARARDLLDKAGFPDGAGFPTIRLVVNRNDTQQRVARSVARMWKQNLSVETQISVRETAEMEASRTSGEYDLIRRGFVLPTTNEMVGLTSIFGSAEKNAERVTQPASPQQKPGDQPVVETPANVPAETGPDSEPVPPKSGTGIELITEADAMHELIAIPLYFPVSYALVRPYVEGFEINGLDAYLLSDVTIDSEWKPDGKNGR